MVKYNEIKLPVTVSWKLVFTKSNFKYTKNFVVRRVFCQLDSSELISYFHFLQALYYKHNRNERNTWKLYSSLPTYLDLGKILINYQLQNQRYDNQMLNNKFFWYRKVCSQGVQISSIKSFFYLRPIQYTRVMSHTVETLRARSL